MQRRKCAMRALVAYMSKTGNTKKVAEAIYDGIECEKEIKPVRDVRDLEGYDLAFLGFPTLNLGPGRSAKRFLSTQARGHRIALFITHGSPEDAEEMPGCLAKFKDAAAGADLVGMFDCQGELASGIKRVMSIFPDPKVRRWARLDSSQGQPDAARLERAREFAREMMARVAG
jgi:flavodoxin